MNEKEMYLKKMHDELSDAQCETLHAIQGGIQGVAEDIMSTISVKDAVLVRDNPRVQLVACLLNMAKSVEQILTCHVDESER